MYISIKKLKLKIIIKYIFYLYLNFIIVETNNILIILNL